MKNKIAVIILTVCAVFRSTVIFAETNTFEDITEKQTQISAKTSEGIISI